MSARLMSLLLLTLLAAACDHSTTAPFAPTPVVPPVPPVRDQTPFSGRGLALTPGETVTGAVVAGDEFCFQSWDARSPCRRFTVTAATDGMLTARVTWGGGYGGSVGDLFIVDEYGRWVVSFEAAPKDVQMRVVAGQRYDVLVMSYPPPSPLEFELTADLTR